MILGDARTMDERGLDIEKTEHRVPTVRESAMRGRQIVEEQGFKLLGEDKSENPRNVTYYLQ